MLNSETLDNYNDGESAEDEGESEDEDMSMAIEPGHTRRYHRCFKVNLCLNISMLATFVGLIAFGPWYTMHYQQPDLTLDAQFTLLLLYTTVEDKAQGTTEY